MTAIKNLIVNLCRQGEELYDELDAVLTLAVVARELLESAPRPSTNVGVADSRAWIVQRDDWVKRFAALGIEPAKSSSLTLGALSAILDREGTPQRDGWFVSSHNVAGLAQAIELERIR